MDKTEAMSPEDFIRFLYYLKKIDILKKDL